MWIILGRLILFGIILTVVHWLGPVPVFAFVYLGTSLVFALALGLLAYHIGYHPILAAVTCVSFFVPMVGLIMLLIVYFQGKFYLKKHGYKIVLMGAKPDPQFSEPSAIDLDQSSESV